LKVEFPHVEVGRATTAGSLLAATPDSSDAERIRTLEAEVARLQAALRDRATELETLFNVIPVSIGVAFDRECKHIRMNRCMAKIADLDASVNGSMTANSDERPTNFVCADVNGKLIPGDQLPMQISARDGLEVRDFEFDVVHEDGRIFRMLGFSAPLLNAEGQPRGSVGAFVDVTERRSAEERERRRLAEIAHVSRLSTLGEMISGLAHEINQPLAAASNFARACQRWPQTAETPLPEEVMRLVQKILSQTERAGEIVKRLTTFVKKGVSTPVFVDVNILVRDVIALTKSCFYPAMKRDLETPLLTDLTPHLPRISVDHIQIEQVLVNLIRNAIEATQEARSSAPVVVRTMRTANAVLISVSDGGTGVASQTTSELFEPFFTTKPEGIGLGLSISRSIIENHGGRLWVEPNADQGATFSFTLPLDAPTPWR
jgi:C4-dicarboxylate-specific signal transduction histidine kinase